MSLLKNSEVNSRARAASLKENSTSVAIIGLAISMGASSVLLPRQGNEAKAAEPQGAEPPATATPLSASVTGETPVPQKATQVLQLAQSDAVSASTPSKLEPSPFTGETPMPDLAPFALPHTTDWHVSKTYHVNALDAAVSKPTASEPPTNLQNVAAIPSGAQFQLPQAPLSIPEIPMLPGRAQVFGPPLSPVARKDATVPHFAIAPDSAQAVSGTAKVQTPAVAHQVKPGDPPDAIAQREGVSRDQRVVIPSKTPTSESPTPTASGVAVPSRAATITNPVDASYKPPAWEAIPKLPLVVEPEAHSSAGIYQSKSGETLSTTLPASNVYGAQLRQANQIEDSQRKLYAERLRDELNQMREKFGTQTEGQLKPIANLPIKGVTPTVTAASNNQSRSGQYINPEFNPREYNQASQRKNQAIPLSSFASIRIKVPAPDTPSTYPPMAAVPPKGTDFYDPALQPPVGQTVAPQFPFPGSNPYRPSIPGNFNGYMWPTRGVLTSGYGMRWGRMHRGIDIAAPIGTPVLAAADGVVIYAHWNAGGYGNLVDIQHPDGSITRYGHNNRILVREGQLVQQGQQIAEMGSTGHSTGPHCHFEVHPYGRGAVNPIALLPPRIS